jgi:hypothetical protein
VKEKTRRKIEEAYERGLSEGRARQAAAMASMRDEARASAAKEMRADAARVVDEMLQMIELGGNKEAENVKKYATPWLELSRSGIRDLPLPKAKR